MLNRALSALLLAVGLLAGLGFPLVADDAAKEVAPKPTTLVGEVVTSGEFVDAAQAIEAATKQGAAKLIEHFDFRALGEITLQGLEVEPDFRKGFMEGIGGESGNKLPTQIANAVKSGFAYKLLRVHRHGDNYAALFRLSSATGATYHDLKLAKGSDGKIKVHDAYMLISGELLSTTLRQMVLPYAKKDHLQLTDEDADFVAHHTQFRALIRARTAKDFSKFKEIYESLPRSMQERKAVLAMRYTAALEAKNIEELSATTNDFRRLYAMDSALDLVGLDTLIRDGKFDQAIAAVDRIEKFVGGDPYLDSLRERIESVK